MLKASLQMHKRLQPHTHAWPERARFTDALPLVGVAAHSGHRRMQRVSDDLQCQGLRLAGGPGCALPSGLNGRRVGYSKYSRGRTRSTTSFACRRYRPFRLLVWRARAQRASAGLQGRADVPQVYEMRLLQSPQLAVVPAEARLARPRAVQ